MLLFLYCPSGKCLSECFRSHNKAKFKLTEARNLRTRHPFPARGGQGSVAFILWILSFHAIQKFINCVTLKSLNDLHWVLVEMGTVVSVCLTVERC